MTSNECPHGGDPHACAPCERAAEQGHGAAVPTAARPRLTVIRARFASSCPACLALILPGDEIARDIVDGDEAWVHIEHLEHEIGARP